VSRPHRRGARPDHLQLAFSIPKDVQRDGSAWPPVVPSPYGTFAVNLSTPGLGGSATYTFAFSRPASGTGGDFSLHVLGMTQKNVGLSESNPYNNGSSLTVRITN